MPAETHMEQDPLGRDAILQLIKDRLGEILEIDPIRSMKETLLQMI